MTTILYVENDEDDIYLFTRRLHKAGYEVIIARDGETGMAMVRSQRPELILMDLDLPVIDGWEASRLLKASAETSHIPIIAISSFVSAEYERRARSMGCDDFFPKPVDMKALYARIEALRCNREGQ